jgi:hypothetical protein
MYRENVTKEKICFYKHKGNTKENNLNEQIQIENDIYMITIVNP